MPNMMDYLAAYGESTVAEAPWCALDSLLLANLCYIDPGPLAATREGITLGRLSPRVDLDAQTSLSYRKERGALMHAMAASRRFGDMRLCHYVCMLEPSVPIQFSAVVCLIPGGTTVIAYRGTDNTLTGWREDLYMSFESPVPAQSAALSYLMQEAALLSGDLMLCGHSKGGNLAAFAAAHATPEVQKRIRSVCSFDGPGLDDETTASEGYARISPVLDSYVPQDSVIGLLMDHESDYRVVYSTASGLRQHDAFSWQTEGADFVYRQSISVSSRLMDRTLHAWLRQCAPAQRRLCVDAIFDLMEATGAPTLNALRQDGFANIARILSRLGDIEPEARQAFLRLAWELVQSSASSAAGMVSEAQAVEQLRQHLSAATSGMQDVMQSISLDTVKQRTREALQHMGTRLVEQALPHRNRTQGDDGHDAPEA